MPDEIPWKFQDALATIPHFQRANALHQRAFENSATEILDARTWHRVAAAVEFKNTNDTRALLPPLGAKNAVEGRRRNRWETQRERERPSRCERAKTGEDGERCCVLKGDIPWMIFYSWPSSPSATSTCSKSPQSRWCRSCRTAVSSASKRGSRPGLMDFTTPWGPLNPHSPSPLTSLSFPAPRAFPHTFSHFHVSAHVHRDKCGVSFFASVSNRPPNFRRFYYALLDHPLRCIGLWRARKYREDKFDSKINVSSKRYQVSIAGYNE